MEKTKALIARAQKGDTGAFEELVALYQHKVYTLCHHLAGNHADAEDLAQDVFIRAYGALGSFRNEADFGTWLHRIAVNTWLNVRRRQPQVVSLDNPVQTDEGEIPRDVAAGDPAPDEALERLELRLRVQWALKELSPEHRAVLVLREMHGYSYEEIGRILACNVGTVRSRLNRARQALRDKITALEADARTARAGGTATKR
ncbi:MAG: RNA polymerase sigma factor [Clostridia bacterium 62_21]|nr:MAG: RNA polymerase sigma factor [Clostridia bacterium 62_21]